MRKLSRFTIFWLLLAFLSGCGGGGGGGGSSDGGSSSGGTSGGGGTTGGGGTSGDGAIRLAWNANSEPELAGYNVYYGTSQGLYSHFANAGPGVSGPAGTVTFTLQGLAKGQVYYIAITAYDRVGMESALSNEVSGAAS